jgi:NADH:ubiquinone oxidoreductase subunit 5 (subunit L)/multisubunit Na+/H+ antiporter MnhA subunit
MYLLLILLPLINVIILSTFGRFLGRNGTIFVTLIIYLFSMILTIIIFYEVCFTRSICYIKLWEWVVIEDLSIHFGFLFDSITCIMCLVVFFISSLVHCYSCGYMNEDPHFIRFLLFLSLFTFFMVIVISADNFVQLFFG